MRYTPPRDMLEAPLAAAPYVIELRSHAYSHILDFIDIFI